MKYVKNKQKIDKKDWHLWFAWKPVVIGTLPDGNEEKAWFETVLRRFVYDTSGVKHGIGGYWRAEYKYRPEEDIPWNDERRLPDCNTKTPMPEVLRTDNAPSSAVCFTLSGECEPWSHPEPKIGLWEKVEFVTPTLEESEGRGSDITTIHGKYCEKCGIDRFCECPESGFCQSCQSNPCRCDGYGLCSNCDAPMDENYDCTSESCPLSKAPWKREERERTCIMCEQSKDILEYSKGDGWACNECEERRLKAVDLNMTGEGLDHQTRIISREEADAHWEGKEKPKHEIDIAWEVKNAKRNKTIM